jgi:hypothetical protein
VRAAPLKGDCLICQAPESIRVAINAVIWPGEGVARSVSYRADAVRVGQESGNPSLATLNVKTITRHAEHIEESWREIGPGQTFRAGEVPVATDFSSVMESGARLGAVGLKALGDALEQDPELWVNLRPKETIAMTKLGLGAVVARETSRLKKNQQVIDVMAIFAAGSGHLPSRGSAEDETEDEIDTMRAAISAERALLAARAGRDA